uniref:Uncharacterized protein n=1 Tax=Cyanothece sp. (strain PCC 7425 / ATCC 29141) TaxID=395961 RepID=B8HLR9_CYAP4
MKISNINVSALLLSFAIVGLIADTMPAPGLQPGIISQTANWIATTIQSPATAAIAPR